MGTPRSRGKGKWKEEKRFPSTLRKTREWRKEFRGTLRKRGSNDMMRERKRKQGEMENESKAHRKEDDFFEAESRDEKGEGLESPDPFGGVLFICYYLLCFFFKINK
jgi:Sec-independent protein translocase protein TatA